MGCFMLLLVIFFAVVSCDRVQYHGDKVFRITPQDENQLKYIQEWIKNSKPELDVWCMANKVGWYIDIHIRKDDVIKVKRMLKQHNIDYKITVEDIEKLITKEKSSGNSPYGLWPWDGFSYDEYNRYHDITTELRYVARKYSSQALLTFNHFKTYRGRQVYGLKLFSANARHAKPAIILHGAMIARDWITSAVLMYMTKLFIEPPEASMKTKIKTVLDNYDIYVYPVVNPDGYEYTHTTDRLWRKNISPQAFNCKGVNLDRNFGAYFGANGLDKEDSCSGQYPGVREFSEQETKGIKIGIDITQARPHKGAVSYWNLHAGGQAILYPYGYRTAATWYDGTLSRVATAFVNGASKRYDTKFQASQASKVTGIAGGQAIDWVYDKGGITYSYAAHLRPGPGDDSKHTFILPESEIKPSSLEFVDGFLEAILVMIKE